MSSNNDGEIPPASQHSESSQDPRWLQLDPSSAPGQGPLEDSGSVPEEDPVRKRMEEAAHDLRRWTSSNSLASGHLPSEANSVPLVYDLNLFASAAINDAFDAFDADRVIELCNKALEDPRLPHICRFIYEYYLASLMSGRDARHHLTKVREVLDEISDTTEANNPSNDDLAWVVEMHDVVDRFERTRLTHHDDDGDDGQVVGQQ